MKAELKEKLENALQADPSIFCDKGKIDETFGSNPDYLMDIFGITKSDLIRLERKGLALKALYHVQKTGEYRARWLIFREALNAK